jgi:tetraacyldisaccharide 4'-kinase
VIAVAGIGRPDQFFAMLRDAGYLLAGTLAFPDHHRYRATDVTRIAAVAHDKGAEVVVTTQKDGVRFEPLGPLPFTLSPIRMSLTIDGWESLSASL